MKVSKLTELLTIAQDAAVEAGKAVLQIYDEGNYQSFSKDDASPVTTADYHANDIIMNILSSRTPDIPVMSEESDNGPLNSRSHWQRYWLIDPIDGTQEFIARSGDFAVNIALIDNNQPVIGVIYWPAGETLYYAVDKKGAFKRDAREHVPIHVRTFDDPESDVVILAISRRQQRERVMSHLSTDRTYQSLPAGSCSLKACFIAEGKADLFLRLGVTGEWDTGASQCIINEAGGAIFDTNFAALTYNQQESLENPDFIIVGDQNVDWTRIVKYQNGEK